MSKVKSVKRRKQKMSAEKSAEVAESLVINGVEYVRADKAKASFSKALDGKPFVLVRTYSAGVFAGYLKSRTGAEVELVQARRLWYWKGANECSDIAQNGVACPNDCKFGEETNVTLTNAIEIHNVTAKAQAIIARVKVWKY